MIRNLSLTVVLYLLIVVLDHIYDDPVGEPNKYRSRMFQFAVYQDFLVILSVMKMMIIERMTLCEVLTRIRNSGLVTQMYVATSVVLHGTLLFDETANHLVRLNPAPYDPPTIKEEQRDLLLL